MVSGVTFAGRRAALALSVCVLLAGSAGLATPDPSSSTAPMRFGVDSVSVGLALDRGLDVSYGTFWMGSWTQRFGWGHAEQQLQAMAARNVTPVVHWWYWGDDISPACVENGCQDPRQNVWKDRATWSRMSEELARVIERTVGTRETIVVIETEFNKGGIENYEPFDGYLADQIAIFRRYGNITPVISFGNWGRAQWSRFDRAAGAADYVGTQLLRSSVRDAGTYAAAIDTLASGARHLQSTFGKPSLITDLGLSSYPSTEYESLQAEQIDQLFARMSELRAAGIAGILYRMLVDDPTFDASNYHGLAERHWGLLRSNRTAKPAFERLAAGIRRLREEVSPSVTPIADVTINDGQTSGALTFTINDPDDDVTTLTVTASSANQQLIPDSAIRINGSGATRTITITTIANHLGSTRITLSVSDDTTTTSTSFNVSVRKRGRAPRNLDAKTNGRHARVTWDAPEDSADVHGYVIEVGSGPGRSDVATVPLAAQGVDASDVPPGTYFIRVRALTSTGLGPPSDEMTMVIESAGPGCGSVTPSLASSVSGSLVTLAWTRPAGNAAASYVVHVGSAPGLSNLLVSAVGGETSIAGHVPNGTYFVRIHATDQCGSSAWSNEVAIRVGS